MRSRQTIVPLSRPLMLHLSFLFHVIYATSPTSTSHWGASGHFPVHLAPCITCAFDYLPAYPAPHLGAPLTTYQHAQFAHYSAIDHLAAHQAPQSGVPLATYCTSNCLRSYYFSPTRLQSYN